MGVKRATAPLTCARNDVSDGITTIRKCQSEVYDQLCTGLIPAGKNEHAYGGRVAAHVNGNWDTAKGLEATSATVTAGKQGI
jgi:hypothetical protein